MWGEQGMRQKHVLVPVLPCVPGHSSGPRPSPWGVPAAYPASHRALLGAGICPRVPRPGRPRAPGRAVLDIKECSCLEINRARQEDTGDAFSLALTSLPATWHLTCTKPRIKVGPKEWNNPRGDAGLPSCTKTWRGSRWNFKTGQFTNLNQHVLNTA